MEEHTCEHAQNQVNGNLEATTNGIGGANFKCMKFLTAEAFDRWVWSIQNRSIKERVEDYERTRI